GFYIGVWLISSIGIKLLPGWGLGQVEELRRSCLLLTGVFAATTTAIFLSKYHIATSRMTLTLSFILCLPLLPLVRHYMKKVLIRFHLYGMQSVIFSDRKTATEVAQSLKEEPDLGYIPTAVFVDDKEKDRSDIGGLPVHSIHDNPETYAHVAILAMPSLSRHRMLEMLEGPLSVYRHIVVIPDMYEAPSLWVKPRDMGGVLGLEISSNLLDVWARLIKRIVDIFLIIVFFPLWSSLFLLITLLVWFQDRKNPFFIHKRAGQNGLDFKIWKFRTMRHDAEEVLEQKLDENQELRIEWETNFKLKEDPRITGLGRFLRKTSLDELPQLINVLKGEMSLVGPRPLPNYHNNELPERIRDMRERVRPGMTGLWQISGRSESGNQGIAKWDTYYVRNWSLWLDIIILFRTIRAVIKKEGAY
ncbi:MAG: undecaprenyl-phosphate galactose phosphotransferase WbaP, partial [Verrucomicrobiota bacterium]